MTNWNHHRSVRALVAAALASLALVCSASSAQNPGAAEELFEKSVRPALVESCQKCHGASKQSSGLRLDSRAAILEGGVNGPAIQPGNPDGSLLVQVVRQTHEDIKMPPTGKLPDAAVDAVATWVKMGAPWPANSTSDASSSTTRSDPASHWAFRPVKPVATPVVKNTKSVRNPVDAFIIARLEDKGITPSPQADRRTLIRRATFDLIGMPPTAAEVEAFANDRREDAFERLIERLLASPHHGERWGRYWLDIARYADTKGYVFNEERRYPYAYTYRDYVVRSLNEDLPYDRFVTDQLAADRLGPDSDRRSLAALGFITLGRRFLNDQADIIADRIDVVSRGLLGLTVACARCHDHKYDPIPTEDYYSLYGIFASSVEPAELPEIPASVNEALNRDFHAKFSEARKKVEAFQTERRQVIEADIRSHAPDYLRAAFEIGFDGKSPKLDEKAKAAGVTSGRLRGLSNRLKQKLDATRGKPDRVLGPWHTLAALPDPEFSRRAPGVVATIAGEDPKNVNPQVARILKEKTPGTMAEAVSCYALLIAETTKCWEVLRKADPKAAALPDPAWEEIRQAFFGDSAPFAVTAETFPKLLDRNDRNTLAELNKKVEQLKATHPGSPPRAMVLNDAPQPYQPHVFLRGNPGRPGKQVPRQFLQLVAGPDRKPFKEGSGRLELARAIASKDNPLTARVIVNRVWMLHFGSGIVSSPSDFGVRSDPPSHPELLDWLAGEFVSHGWSLKWLHRTLMLSATYRQSSNPRPELATKDPENRLYARFNRRRLDFEATRDSLLAASGALDRSIGGPGVPIGEPPFVPRRTLYGFIDRQNLDGVYRTFDFASPDSSSPRRFVTTVPQQALYLMNSPFIIEQARRLGSGVEASTSQPVEERVRGLYRSLFGRDPDDRELNLGAAFVRHRVQAGPALPVPEWSYGSGRFDDARGRLAEFCSFPHWSGSAWQYGATLPHPEGSYLHWHAGGGHAGPEASKPAILRWTAPADGTYSTQGTIGHEGNLGDGIRGRVVSSRTGVVGEWVAHNAKIPTPVAKVDLKAGDTLDFVVDCRSEQSYDSFTWAPVVKSDSGTWDSKAGFHGPVERGLTPWQQYAQVLLLSNEFVFVD